MLFPVHVATAVKSTAVNVDFVLDYLALAAQNQVNQ